MRWFLVAALVASTTPAMSDPVIDRSYPPLTLEQGGMPSFWPKEDRQAKADGFDPRDIVDVELDGAKKAGDKVAVRGYLMIVADGYALMSNRRDGSNPILVDYQNASRVLRSNILNVCSDRKVTCILQVRGTLTPIAKQPASVFIDAED